MGLESLEQRQIQLTCTLQHPQQAMLTISFSKNTFLPKNMATSSHVRDRRRSYHAGSVCVEEIVLVVSLEQYKSRVWSPTLHCSCACRSKLLGTRRIQVRSSNIPFILMSLCGEEYGEWFYGSTFDFLGKADFVGM